MGDKHLWIGSQAVAHDLLAKRPNIYSGRPVIPAVPGTDQGREYLVLLAYDDVWRRQRKLAQSMITASHNASFHGYIDLEAKRFLSQLLGDPKDYYRQIQLFCARFAARLAYGSPVGGHGLLNNSKGFIRQVSLSGPITNTMPFLGHLPEFLNPSKAEVRLRRESEQKLWCGLMKQAQETYDESSEALPPSYARFYLDRSSAEHEGSKASASFSSMDDHEVAYTMGMVATVAIFTIVGPLNTFLLALLLHPEWQSRARAEVDNVISTSSDSERVVIDPSDAPKLPILRAVIKECLRWRPPLPLSIPRITDGDDVYKGRFIRKEMYPDPEEFNPARWLEPQYPTYREPLTEHPKLPGYHQFGTGRRACPGSRLTQVELLVTCSDLLANFRFEKEVDVNGHVGELDPWGMTPHLITVPLEFPVVLKPRDDAAATRIRAAVQDTNVGHES